MNDRLNYEMERAILSLQASMPGPRRPRTSVLPLLRIAASEMNVVFLLALFAGTLSLGAAAARFVSLPMLTSFCTAPLPMLLLFHRYVLNRNEPMRELEGTLPYSYAEMLIARTAAISLYALVFLLSLSALLHHSAGGDFLRLALCGAVPSVYLCTLLLFLSNVARNQESIAIIAVVLWIALCFFALLLPFNDILRLCPTGLYAALTAAGFVLYCFGFYQVKARGNGYAISIG